MAPEITHHTSHTMGNGASSSSSGAIGGSNTGVTHHTSHTMENGAASGAGGGGNGGNVLSSDDGHHQGPGGNTSFVRLDADLGTLADRLTLTEHAESGQNEHAAQAGSPSLSSSSVGSGPPSDMDESDASAIGSPITTAYGSIHLPDFNIIDTTLREGEQFATGFFNTEQKMQICRALDDFGVDFIELTNPVASEESRRDCERIAKMGLKAKVLCHIRCHMNDARVAAETGADGINMCIGTSKQLMENSHGKDLAYIAATAKEIVSFARSKGLEVRFSGEDTFRSDFDEMIKLYTLMDSCGADRIGIADTVGGATPMDVYNKLSAVRKAVSCGIETHFHNDTGCANANAITAFEAGATHFDTTVLGIGERNGITSLGGLMACMRGIGQDHILGRYNLEKLAELEKLVAEIVSVEIPFNVFKMSQKCD